MSPIKKYEAIEAYVRLLIRAEYLGIILGYCLYVVMFSTIFKRMVSFNVKLIKWCACNLSRYYYRLTQM